MTASAADLALIRAEIGSTTPPTTPDLHRLWGELRNWRLVALRVLRTRLADLTQDAGATKVTIPDVITYEGGLAPAERARILQRQIDALQAAYDRDQATPSAGAYATVLRRPTHR